MADAPNKITRLLTSLLTPVQEIEDALQQLYTERAIDTAVGVQLDLIGKLVGQPRDGMEDEEFRRYCRARISAHQSTGSPEEIITVTDLVVSDDGAYLHLELWGEAAFVMRVEDAVTTADVAAIVHEFLLVAAAAGVRPVVEFGVSDPTGWFRLDSGPGWDQGHLIGVTG